ncbi:hypothetical protein [Flagellimonas sp.]|uniref:hypothetical protein n=1 Tax=Flagellimonas sp. TaxID=2058762 RepID=UPI003F4A4985
MEILKGIGYCVMVISIYKYIHYKWFRDSILPFNWKYWFNKNLGDYLMLVAISFITVQYSNEIIDLLNMGLEKFTIDWRIPHFEDITFYWILMPVIVPLILGKFAKKKIRKPLSDRVKSFKK